VVVTLKDTPLRVLVTGGSGFVGRHLVALLDTALAPGSEILVGVSDGLRPDGGSDDFAPRVSARTASRTVLMDIVDADQVNAVIRTEQPTHVTISLGLPP